MRMTLVEVIAQMRRNMIRNKLLGLKISIFLFIRLYLSEREKTINWDCFLIISVFNLFIYLFI